MSCNKPVFQVEPLKIKIIFGMDYLVANSRQQIRFTFFC